MQFLIELLPLLAFFIAYKWYGFIVATAVLIVFMVLLCAYKRARTGKIEPMLFYSTVLVVVAGMLTILFNDPAFIQWKPTILSIGIACLLFAGLYWDKNFLKKMLDSKIQLAKNDWGTMTMHWSLFFTVLGLSNAAAVLFMSFDHWVTFKVFGLTIINLIFLIFEGFWLYTRGAIKQT